MSASKTMCVVMDTPVDKKTDRSKRLVREFKGETYYLCCQTCATLFDKDPAKYTADKS